MLLITLTFLSLADGIRWEAKQSPFNYFAFVTFLTTISVTQVSRGFDLPTCGLVCMNNLLPVLLPLCKDMHSWLNGYYKLLFGVNVSVNGCWP